MKGKGKLMLFKPYMVKLMYEGRKTQTRRLVSEKDEGIRKFYNTGQIVTVRTNGRLKWELGKKYAVQPGMYTHSVGRITLLAIRRERLDEMSIEDVQAEGFNSRAEFDAVWDSLAPKGKKAADNPEVWVLEFAAYDWSEKEGAQKMAKYKVGDKVWLRFVPEWETDISHDRYRQPAKIVDVVPPEPRTNGSQQYIVQYSDGLQDGPLKPESLKPARSE